MMIQRGVFLITGKVSQIFWLVLEHEILKRSGMKHKQEGTCVGKGDWHCQDCGTFSGFHIQRVVKGLGNTDSNAVRESFKSMIIV